MKMKEVLFLCPFLRRQILANKEVLIAVINASNLFAGSWNIRPGDWVECFDGYQDTVLSTCSLASGDVIAVEVGFDWYSIADVISWIPEY